MVLSLLRIAQVCTKPAAMARNSPTGASSCPWEGVPQHSMVLSLLRIAHVWTQPAATSLYGPSRESACTPFSGVALFQVP